MDNDGHKVKHIGYIFDSEWPLKVIYICKTCKLSLPEKLKNSFQDKDWKNLIFL